MADTHMLGGCLFTVLFICLLLIATLSCLFLFYNKYVNGRRKEVIIFTRYPIPGKSKTRLIPALGSNGAAKLQVLMTEHMLHSLQEVYTSDNNLQVTLQYNGGNDSQMKFWIQRKLGSLKCAYRLQAEGNLGQKLTSAVKESFKRGNKQVIVIGADIPGINRKVIQKAFSELCKSETDMVIGHALDGGYYLVGFNSGALKYIDGIFEDIDWGTESVFQQQMCRAKLLQASVAVLPFVLQDVDTGEDICVFEREVGMSRQQLCDERWSIVIPTLNEGENILDCLNNIIQNVDNVSGIREIIITDGGSTDDTVEKIKLFSSTSPIKIIVCHSKSGRGNQLIHGAREATGGRLLFLHADSRLPSQFDTHADQCLNTPGIVAGAFKFQLDVLTDLSLQKSEPWWFILQMRLLVWGTHIRACKYEKPYGDQTLFMNKRTYKQVGGFPPFYLMEDYILVEKLRTIGHIGIVDEPVITSYRRWRKWGYLKVTGLSQLIIAAYHCGVHPNTLAKWYYGEKLKID